MGDFDESYWKNKLGDLDNPSLDTKLRLILSLVIFLGVSIRHLLTFIFTTQILAIKTRAARFLGYTPTHSDPNGRFPAAHIFSLWVEHCSTTPAQREQILQMITPVVQAEVLRDSDRVITDMSLQIRIKDLTIARIRELLDPSKLADKYRTLAPFFFELLHVFVASPNKYRKYEMEQRVEGDGVDGESAEERSGENARDWDDDPNEDHDEDGHPDAENTSQWEGFEGFSRNPIFVSYSRVFSSLQF